MSNNHIVYAAFDEKGVCLYVGEGKHDRYKHITSGVSHVYEANKWHFKNKFIEVKVIHNNLSKELAMKLECEEINRLKPVWNKVEASQTYLNKMKKFVTEKIKDFSKTQTSTNSSRIALYTKLAKDLCSVLNSNGETKIFRLQKWSSMKESSGVLSALARGGAQHRTLQHIFEVVKSTDGTIYVVKLKDWKCKEERKDVSYHA